MKQKTIMKSKMHEKLKIIKDMKEYWTKILILNKNMKNTEQLGCLSNFSTSGVLYDLFNVK